MYIWETNVSMCLNNLCKKDEKWREIAFKICKDKMLADDLVQEMYLKLHNKDIDNEFYVILTIKSIFLNTLKTKEKKTKKYIEEINQIIINDDNFELSDDEIQILENFKKLKWHQQKLLQVISEGESYRSIEKKYNIDTSFAFREVKQAKQILING